MIGQRNKPYLICLTGLTGCGKTTIKNMFASYIGVKTFYTKDLHSVVIGEKALMIDKMDISLSLSSKYDFIKKIMDYISQKRHNAKVVVLDSIRSTDELKYIKERQEYNSVLLVRVTCSGTKRIERLKKRDHCDNAAIQKRDLRDMGKDDAHLFNMQDLFKKADLIIDTSGTFKNLQQQVFSILSDLIEKPQKLKLSNINMFYKEGGY